MIKPIIELKKIEVLADTGRKQFVPILQNINLKINKGDFITIVGTNGAGKSTLFNVITGSLKASQGQLLHQGKDITKLSEEQRPRFLSRVFQDPKMGTAPRMTVAENLLLAVKRGESRYLKPRNLKSHIDEFKKLARSMNNGLENRLHTPTDSLSGGQRQALSFLMAVVKHPDIILLDEHTAALDPHTSASLMAATDRHIVTDHLTALMITHQLSDAIKYGNRMLILNQGKIIADLNESEKNALTVEKLERYLTN